MVYINLIVGVYIPIIRISYSRWDDHPQYRELIDPGTYGKKRFLQGFSFRSRDFLMTITQEKSRLVQYSPDVRFLAKTSYAFCILDSNIYSQAGTYEHSQRCCNEVVKLVGSLVIPNPPKRLE